MKAHIVKLAATARHLQSAISTLGFEQEPHVSCFVLILLQGFNRHLIGQIPC